MATKVILYIGADNETGQITSEYERKIEQIIGKYYDNFTLTKHKGCYQGQIEDSISAVIFVLQLIFKDLHDCIKELKIKLVQETIGLEIIADVDFKLR